MIQNKSKTQNTYARKAQIGWLEGSVPCSTRFDDPYYSRQDGLAETRYVFLDGNRLAERFAVCDRFTIAELGFGTGLNFLATSQLWHEIAPPTAKLDFFSFEQFPMAASDMAAALAVWPELTMFANPLFEAWENHDDRTDALELKADSISLTILFGDANTHLPQAGFSADAWFLDGFSPAKNPELWNEVLMAEVFRHTRPGGTLATYSAAGWVRRNLDAAGFRSERQPGYAGKRQMTAAIRPE